MIFAKLLYVPTTNFRNSRLMSRTQIDRISKAIERRETFRCIILLTQPEDLSHRVVPLVQYEYYTINRGETSMVSQLKSR
jgi:hypothetical protein